VSSSTGDPSRSARLSAGRHALRTLTARAATNPKYRNHAEAGLSTEDPSDLLVAKRKTPIIVVTDRVYVQEEALRDGRGAPASLLVLAHETLPGPHPAGH
jgi:hypothetical protein